MKCSHCGAELKDGSLFCSECGRKIEVQKQSFCQVCGHALSAGSKFCPECGASISIPSEGDSSERFEHESREESAVESPKSQWSNGKSGEYRVPEPVPPYKQNSKSKDFFQKWKEKLLEKWRSLDTFLKIVTVALGLAILLLIIAVFSHRILASLISILQIAGLVIVAQMHKGKIKGTDTRSKNLVLGVMLAFFVLNFASRTISPIDTYRIKRMFESKSEKTTTNQQASPDYDDIDEILAGFTEFDTTNTEVTQEARTASTENSDARTETTKQVTATTELATTESATTKPATTKPTTTKPTTTKPSTTKPTTTKAKPENNSMPIMTGTSIDQIDKQAKEHGLSKVYSDEDFGHETKKRNYEGKNGGLMLSVIYSTETKEILTGRIVTINGLSTAEEQKTFIKDMASVLCPQSDSQDVAKWVKTNIGTTSEKTINGFIYELSFGPSGNALYYAGEKNWEEWDLSLS